MEIVHNLLSSVPLQLQLAHQPPPYDAAFSENLVNPRVLGGLILDL
jgi:hypothetical protein